MTEDEAKAKWCPMQRIVVATKKGSGADIPLGQPTFNVTRFGDGSASNLGCCIGSACMMWRGSLTHGFCGLAGRPR